jgi:hypothetical protein
MNFEGIPRVNTYRVLMLASVMQINGGTYYETI